MSMRVGAVVRKELRELRRDPITIWIAFALPIIMLFLFGYAIRMDVADVPMAVLDLDRSNQSAALVDAFVNTGDYRAQYYVRGEREVEALLDRGKVRLALVIPSGFQRDLLRDGTAEIQTLIDGSFSATAAIIRNQSDAIITDFALRTIPAELAETAVSAATAAQARVWYNPGLESRTFVVPGLFAVILMAFPPLLTALAVVREKETGSVQQIYVSPLKPWEFIAGKMIPYVLIAFAELAVIVALGLWWFRLPFRGSPILFTLGAALYVLCTVGIGLLVSTVTRSQLVALLLAMVITLMPSMLFSGFMYPIVTMPEAVQWYTRLFPARYFTDVSRGIVLKGVGAGALTEQLALLAGYTTLVFAVSALRFRKKVA